MTGTGLEEVVLDAETIEAIRQLARQVTAAERAEDAGGPADLSLLPDPNVGALTQILREYAPARR